MTLLAALLLASPLQSSADIMGRVPRRLAEDAPRQEPQEEQDEVPERPEPPGTIELMPETSLYKPYLADPRQPKTGTKVQVPLRGDSSGNTKIENVLGGFRPLARWTDARNPDIETELILEAAVFSRFDIQESWDMDAADYRFGFPFLHRHGDTILKVHVYHITSHLGDEYISREKKKRDSYHLNELAAGFSFPPVEGMRIYGEAGIAVYTGPETESGRAQLGGEWKGETWFERVGPLLAIDLQTRNEIDWTWNAAAMVGLVRAPSNGFGHGMRLTLEYYRGRDVQTQFKLGHEHFLGVALTADF